MKKYSENTQWIFEELDKVTKERDLLIDALQDVNDYFKVSDPKEIPKELHRKIKKLLNNIK